MNKKDLRRKKIDLVRATQTRYKREFILIVCEGKNTEPSYFNHFRLTNATIKPVGTGLSTCKLVDEAKILKENEDPDAPYDQVWCVFDCDDNHDFKQAIQSAQKENFKVAYSNQAFEYWLLLHFIEHNGNQMHRKFYCDKLNKALKQEKLTFDCKSKLITQNLFDKLFKYQELAIARAQKIYNNQKTSAAESSTTVFQLVLELMKYKKG